MTPALGSTSHRSDRSASTQRGPGDERGWEVGAARGPAASRPLLGHKSGYGHTYVMTMHADPRTHLSVPRACTHAATFPAARSRQCPRAGRIQPGGKCPQRARRARTRAGNVLLLNNPSSAGCKRPSEPRHDRDTWRLGTSSPRSELTRRTLRWHMAPFTPCPLQTQMWGRDTRSPCVAETPLHTGRESPNLQGPI